MTNRSASALYDDTLTQVGRNETRSPRESFRQWQIREGEVLYRFGVQQLSNTHLLAHLLRDQALAERLMARFGSLTQIVEASVAELKQVCGVGSATAEIIQTASELSRRLLDFAPEYRPRIGSPIDAYLLVQPEFRGEDQEMTK